MNLFIADAWAQNGGAPGAGGGLGMFLPLILLFAVFYFMAIRPQQKRAKEHRAMLDALKKGDEVVTSGGTLGRVTAVGDNFVGLEIADGVEIKIQRQAVQTMMPKGTIKSA
jgi:preprotein translocase subunit YajC